MPVDSSIYQAVKPIQFDITSPLDTAQKAMSLGALGMQQMQMQRQMQSQNAIREAYAANTDPTTGALNKQGVLSQLGKVAPQAALELGSQFAAQDKAQAEAQNAKIDGAQKALGVVMPAMDYLAGMPEDQRRSAYSGVMNQLKEQGVDTSKMPVDYDQGKFMQTYKIGQKSKPYLEQLLAGQNLEKGSAEIKKINSEIKMAPAKLAGELYGRGSPNAQLTGEYTDQVKPIRSSQLAMNQMLDNYNHPTPQGDASLILNAFKIKFPNAPDVNSLEELSKSESLPTQWKQALSHRVNGLFTSDVRDDLMRDGISTFRANVQSLDGVKDRTNTRQQQFGVADPSMTAEPAIDRTFKEAMELQKKIGPYKPPADRDDGGIMSKLSKAFGGEKSAEASTKKESPQTKYREAGSTVSADEVAKYATKHNMKLSDAQSYLKGQGYAIDR